ncbi:hypothetical protein ACO7_180039 [Thiomonas arsenitoxydans]|nr:hypothetical protein ACO3_200021 [Thiomonas arsenitoxydans]CQR29474.1 hypothetical protein ACO7_180039 [Thiomonas arsenitoxydans]
MTHELASGAISAAGAGKVDRAVLGRARAAALPCCLLALALALRQQVSTSAVAVWTEVTAAGRAGVQLPDVLDGKCPCAGKQPLRMLRTGATAAHTMAVVAISGGSNGTHSSR